MLLQLSQFAMPHSEQPKTGSDGELKDLKPTKICKWDYASEHTQSSFLVSTFLARMNFFGALTSPIANMRKIESLLLKKQMITMKPSLNQCKTLTMQASIKVSLSQPITQFTLWMKMTKKKWMCNHTTTLTRLMKRMRFLLRQMHTQKHWREQCPTFESNVQLLF